ncbi:MAG: metallophosphoesterase [Kofleriaceae bacterium]
MLTFSDDATVAEQQMHALIFYLVAFGYIDGEFDRAEKTFVKAHIRQLVEARAQAAMTGTRAATKADVVERFVAHFHEVFEQTDQAVQALFDEAVGDGEKVEQFVYAKLKLRCYEIFHSFDEDNQRALLEAIEELIYADGSVHPAEGKFRDELTALLGSEIPLDDVDVEVVGGAVEIDRPAARRSRLDNHPFFDRFEEHYSSDPERLRSQTEADLALMARFCAKLAEQRAAGGGKLAGKQDLGEFAGERPFLDGHVYVHPTRPGGRYELFVLGDLHGCYSCLKAAILQADFFAKLEAWRLDPATHPEPKFILLGDYIDRGRFSYNGVLRTVMQLFLAAPEHVFVLRGNHEYYVEYQGRIYGGVKPAEAINTLVGHMPGEVFSAYMQMFDQLPNMLFLDRLMFVHAGIPRDADVEAKLTDLAALNDDDLRFQMLWSDPSTADYIPDELQAQNARFPFGQRQFEAFMKRIGATMLVRGHEKVDEGFRDVYPGRPIALLNLFSAGGHNNDDLPPGSSYRSVTPMAATISIEGGTARVVPWEIDYARFNDPFLNHFFATKPEIEHKIG